MRAIVVMSLTFVLAACGKAPTIEDLGLDISVDVESGGTLEVAVPTWTDTMVGVLMAPEGVLATFRQVDANGQQVLRIEVEEGVAAGPYTLVLQAERGGEAHLLDWPFSVRGES